ncbi:hypothetical protein JOQ06_027764 [Pogonophryne albipinna]|uniref:Ig-like domain-containing protein n=1 Tax=Pogonophryne albipinna TaxID=1090488 RepID=A0AAD6A927_9TELE|nr:hypothetical protein JOQ06_027764 [Pogonophryne albipinna]
MEEEILRCMDEAADSFTVRAGYEVTLPCDNVVHDQDKCESSLWFFSDSGSSAGVTLFEDGRIHKEAKAKSDRLRVTEKCSLVIKKVTEEDAGLYSCIQIRSGEEQGSGSQVFLSVVTSRLRLIIVSVGLAALIITVVTVNIWTRAKGSKAQTEENMEQNEEDEDEDEADYENDGGASASV